MLPGWIANVPRLQLDRSSDGQYGLCAGRARARTEVEAPVGPLSGRSCIGYHVILHVLGLAGWVPSGSFSSIAAFEVTSPSGRAQVEGGDAWTFLESSVDTVAQPRRARLDVFEHLLRQVGIHDGEWRSAYPPRYWRPGGPVWELRCVETLLEDGDRVAICGGIRRELSKRPGSARGYRDIDDDLHIAPSRGAPLLLVSQRSLLRNLGH